MELSSQSSDRNAYNNRKLHKLACSHLSTLGICNAYLNIRQVFGCSLIGQIFFFIREGLELIGTYRGKLGMKLAIVLIHEVI